MQFQCAQQQVAKHGDGLFTTAAQDTQGMKLEIPAPVIGPVSVATGADPLDDGHQLCKRRIAGGLVRPKPKPVLQPGCPPVMTDTAIRNETRQRVFNERPHGLGILGREG